MLQHERHELVQSGRWQLYLGLHAVRAQILHPCHLDAASRRLQQSGLTDAHIPRTRSAAPCSGNSVDEFVEPGQLTLAAEDGILGNVAVRGDGKR